MVSVPVPVPRQPSTATVTQVDDNTSNAQPVWVSWGSPTYLNSTQVNTLIAASQLAPKPLTVTPNGATALTFTVKVPAYGVALVTLPKCA